MILQHKNGAITSAYYRLKQIKEDEDAGGFIPSWDSSLHATLERLKRGGLIDYRYSGPRGGKRCFVTEKANQEMAAVRIQEMAAVRRGEREMKFDGIEVTVKNIRDTFKKVEGFYLSAKADGDRDEVEVWDSYMEKLLTKMTPEQRSWCIDDFSEVPGMYQKVWSAIQEQEK